MEKSKQKIDSLNFFKAIACIGIVLIHCKFPGEIGGIIKTIARFGVPFFFMLSGFFSLYGEKIEYNKEKMKNKIKHIIIITVGAILFYLVFHLLFYCIIQGNSIIDEFNSYVSIDGFVKFIIQNSTFCYSHLWFLFGLIYCYFFAMIMKDKIKGGWKKYYIAISLGIFIITSEILPILKIDTELVFGIKICNIFLFRALPFYLLGVYLKEHNDLLLNKTWINNKVVIPIILSGFAVSILERFLSKESNFYFGTIISVYFIFIFCLKNKGSINRYMEYIGDSLSLYIYIIHIAIYKIVIYIFQCANLSNSTIINWMKPIVVILVSLLIAYIYNYSKNKIISMKRRGDNIR